MVLALLFHEPRKPKVLVPPGEIDPLYPTFVTVGLDAVPLSTPSHSELTVWPLAKVHVTRQPVIAVAPLLVTVTPAWKPPPHWPVTA